MATNLTQAWKSLRQGNWGEARRGFQTAARSESGAAWAYLGLAGAAVATGQLRDAQDFGERAFRSSNAPEARLVLGEIHSRMGNRREAESHLEHYLDEAGPEPYALALLGEQKVRTGRWDEGIDTYLDALRRDSQGRAARQLRRVLADLVDTVQDGKLPEKFARQFVNKLDYNLGSKSSAIQQSLAEVRRCLNSGNRMDGPEGTPVLLEILADHGIQTGAALPGRSEDSASQAPGGRPQQSGPPDVSGAEVSGAEDDEDKEGIEAKQKDLAAVIQGDREANESLQSEVGQMPPPDWPSAPAYGQIDPLEPMAWKEQSIFANQPDMDATDFRITSGSVRAEIFLERCLQNLLAAAKRDRAVAVQFRPEAITQLEVNCWDGLLERLPPVSPIYDEFHDAEVYKQLAVGRFIGECVALAYDGTWEFREPPEASTLHVGNTRLDPLKLAGRWLDSGDVDAVSLEVLSQRAARAAESSTSMTVEQNYIDPTRELEGHSLAVKLAEMWTGYLFRLADTSFADIAETIQIEASEEAAILFQIAPRWCPEHASGPDGAGRSDEGRVTAGYLREDGRFLLVGSRKHAAAYLGKTLGSLDQETAGAAAEWLATYHRPGWSFVLGESEVQSLRDRTGRDAISQPVLRSRAEVNILEMWARTDGPLVELTLRHNPTAEIEWQLEHTPH